ncbi:MAG: hypothetical protein N2319_06805 [Candidatus Kapabacteria bacterium]|nr:hypothetical protein [Candidatus Kapabacteria bacterium]
MKNLFLVLTLCFLFTNSAFSQFEAGQSEIGGSLGVGSSTYESSVGSSSYSSSYNFFMLSALYSYYVIDGFSAEPEFILYAIEKSKPTILALLNLSYTMKIPGFFFSPYGRIGYGLSNGMSMNIPTMLSRSSNDFNIGVLNIGIGIKTLIGNSGIIRAELNYRSYSKSEKSGNMDLSYKHNIIGILIGLSILLR